MILRAGRRGSFIVTTIVFDSLIYSIFSSLDIRLCQSSSVIAASESKHVNLEAAECNDHWQSDQSIILSDSKEISYLYSRLR